MAIKPQNLKGTITCLNCGKETPKRGPSQKYCPECSAQKDRERKLKWAKNNPQTWNEELSAKRKEEEKRRKQLGAEKSKENAANICWPAKESEADSLTNLIRVSIPFSYNFSKNSVWSLGNTKGHVYARREANEAREQLAWLIKKAGKQWYEGKVWIDIFVEKPDMRGDAINVIDLVCDAVKDAIGIDDRWYCIRRLDWAVVKDNPKIYVGVGQAIKEHHRICSTCGRLLPLTEFNKQKGVRLGRARVCKECSKALKKNLHSGSRQK